MKIVPASTLLLPLLAVPVLALPARGSSGGGKSTWRKWLQGREFAGTGQYADGSSAGSGSGGVSFIHTSPSIQFLLFFY